jgi:PKD repeat protein
MKRPRLARLGWLAFLGVQIVVGFSSFSLAVAGDESLADVTAGNVVEGATVPSSSLGSAAATELGSQTESAAVPPVLAKALFISSTLVAMTNQTVTFDASPSWSAHLVVLYEWDFDGDGGVDAVAASPVIEHAYVDDGVFIVRLVTIDDQGVVTSSVVPVAITVANRVPTAVLNVPAGMLRAQVPMQFSGDASSDADGSVVALHWEYGDGSSGEGSDPIHTYEAAGTYVVRLTVTDDDGAASVETSAVLIEDAPPSAGFTVEDSIGAGTLAVWFVDTTVVANPADIAHIGWDFGDGVYRAGGPSSDGVYMHVYALPGEYDVTLYVIDKYGAMSVVSQSVWIRN